MMKQKSASPGLEEQDSRKQSVPAEEKYYTVEQLADRWNVSPRMIERIFMNDPRVAKVGITYRGEQRIQLRIPEVLAQLVFP